MEDIHRVIQTTLTPEEEDALAYWSTAAGPLNGYVVSLSFARRAWMAQIEHEKREDEKPNKPPKLPPRPNAPAQLGGLALGNT